MSETVTLAQCYSFLLAIEELGFLKSVRLKILSRIFDSTKNRKGIFGFINVAVAYVQL